MTTPVASVKDQELFLKAAEQRYAELGVPPEQAVQLFDAQYQKLAEVIAKDILTDYLNKKATSCGSSHDKKKSKKKKKGYSKKEAAEFIEQVKAAAKKYKKKSKKKKDYDKKATADLIEAIKEAALRHADEMLVPRKVAQQLITGALSNGIPPGKIPTPQPGPYGNPPSPDKLQSMTADRQAVPGQPPAVAMRQTNVAGAPPGPIASKGPIGNTVNDTAAVLNTGGGTPASPKQPTSTGESATGDSSYQPPKQASDGTTTVGGDTTTITVDSDGKITAEGGDVTVNSKEEKSASVDNGLTPEQKRAYDMMADIIKHANEKDIK